MDGKKPKRVTAITKQWQPENNPKVEDEAIILLEYEGATAIIEASWNWPIGRKDMEIYGLTGAVFADNRHSFRMRMAEGYDGYTETLLELPEREAPYDDPFRYFAAVIEGEIEVSPTDLSALENNMTVMEILDAARESAERGQSVPLE